MNQSLSIMGYQTRFISYPYGRLPATFQNNQIDATIVTLKKFDAEVFYSDIVLPEYQTVAIHLTRNNLKISKIEDLNDKSILAHQRAHLFYGEEYKKISESNKQAEKYNETARQDSQVLMLFKERVEVIVLAHEIFMYYKNKSSAKELNKEYEVSKVFGDKFGFHNAFRNKKVRDDFNKGLAKIKSNGTYSNILNRYLIKQNNRAGDSQALF